MIEIDYSQIKEQIVASGIGNPTRLQEKTGIAYAQCWRIFNEPIMQISASVLEKLCQSLKKTPNELLMRRNHKTKAAA